MVEILKFRITHVRVLGLVEWYKTRYYSFEYENKIVIWSCIRIMLKNSVNQLVYNYKVNIGMEFEFIKRIIWTWIFYKHKKDKKQRIQRIISFV